MTTVTAWTPTTADAVAVADTDRAAYDRRCLTSVQWSKWLRSSSLVAVAVGDRRRPAAVAAVEPDGDGWFRLWRLGVRPGERRRGCGRWLVTALGGRYGLRLRLREDNRQGLEFATAVGFGVVAVERGGCGDCDAVELERPADGDDGRNR